MTGSPPPSGLTRPLTVWSSSKTVSRSSLVSSSTCDEAPVLDGLLPLLGVELPHVRVAPAQHVHEDHGQHYEDNEIEKPAASKDSAQNLYTFPECI